MKVKTNLKAGGKCSADATAAGCWTEKGSCVCPLLLGSS
jgi:hypothetical protein